MEGVIEMADTYTKEELVTYLKDYFLAAPEAAKEVFFYSMLSCVQNFTDHAIEGVLACVGRRATMKTTTSRVCAAKEIKFLTIKDFAEDYASCNLENKKVVLIDDIFPKMTQYSELKQAELLNKIVRYGDRKMGNIGIIITMEYLPKLLPSGRDRVWAVKFPLLNGNVQERETKWKKIATLPTFIEELMQMFQDILENQREQVQDYIESYLANYMMPKDLTYETRIPIYMKYLLLSEELFYKYFLSGNNNCYDRQKYIERVVKSAYIQQQEVFDSENATDLVKATYHIFASGKLSKCPYDQYTPNGNNFTVIRGKSFIMVSSAALLGAINKYLHRTISKQVLNKALSDAGVVEMENGSVTKSTSSLHCRHYFINYNALCEYVNTNYYYSTDSDGEYEGASEDMIIDVIRKR